MQLVPRKAKANPKTKARASQSADAAEDALPRPFSRVDEHLRALAKPRMVRVGLQSSLRRERQLFVIVSQLVHEFSALA
jgi:hypothetical protein